MKVMRRRQWRDLSAGQKFSIGLLTVVQFTLLGAALWDIRQRSSDEIVGTKRMWTAAAFVNYIGPIAYFLFGRKR